MATILDALIKLVASLAWPVAVVVIVARLRKEIAALLSRLKRGKWGSAEAEFAFADYVSDVEEQAEIPRSPEIRTDPDVLAQATGDPRGAILSAWLKVETALSQLIEAHHLSEGYKNVAKRPLAAINLVQRKNLLSINYVGLFNDLRAMRNEAAHSADFSPPPDAVLRYVQLAAELVAEMRRQAESSA